MKRREFLLKTSAAGVVVGATPFLNISCTGPHKLKKVGLQLFSLGGLMTEDFEGTLEQVAAAGYDQVEFAGYYGQNPEEIRPLLDRLGLTSPSNHARNLFTDDGLAEAIEAAKVIGHEYLISAMLPRETTGGEQGMPGGGQMPEGFEMPEGGFQRPEGGQGMPGGGQMPEGFEMPEGGFQMPEGGFQMPAGPTYTAARIKEIAADFNHVGEVCRQSGLKFAFHNHQAEFSEVEDGGILYNILLDETDPDLVFFEMDLGWAIAGGADPLAYFAKAPGRFHLFHVKDIDENNWACVVGEGTIDFAPIFAQSRQAGVKYYIVEQDMPPDPMANVTSSVQYLKSMTF